jgi:transcription antitermination factor NusG
MTIGDPPTTKVLKDAWYAIYAKHQHERSAADLLARKGFEILLPMYRSIRRWKDRDKSVLSPLFPCYLFVRTDLSRKVDILRTPGVFWLVESGGCACHIPDADIEGINKIVQTPDRIAPHPYLKSGEWVRVRHGSLRGLEGILTRVKNQYRVVLTIEPLQKAVAVEVDISAIEPLPGNDPNASSAIFSRPDMTETAKGAPLARAAAAGTPHS